MFESSGIMNQASRLSQIQFQVDRARNGFVVIRSDLLEAQRSVKANSFGHAGRDRI
jgi:hypothetical protein